jgi:putative transposase
MAKNASGVGMKPSSVSRLPENQGRFCGDIVRADAETGVVLAVVTAVLGALRALVRPRTGLVLENLALRQQLAILNRKAARPRLRSVDRAFWAVLSRVWSRWVDALIIVKPATVVSWHRRGFARFWAHKSRRVGRPPLDARVVALIEQMSTENPLWSRRRIASELAKLGVDVDKDTVARYMPKPPRQPGQQPSTTWRAFVRAHLPGTIAIDFLIVPTVTFRLLYVFFVLSLERRRILHVNVTGHPHQAWTAQQVVEAVGLDTDIARLIRDRDAIYGTAFDSRVNHLGIHQIKIAPRSPWQNGYAERFVGTLRREVLDHVIALSERHLLRLVRSHATYYNEDRPHMALCRDAPVSRAVEPPTSGDIVAFPRVAGLHHRYARAA